MKITVFNGSPKRDFSKLRYITICGCGFSDSEDKFGPVIGQFKKMFRDHSTVITVPEAPMFNAPEAASVTKPFLQTVSKAGREYAPNGEISAETTEKLNIPMIPHEVYVDIVNKGV